MNQYELLAEKFVEHCMKGDYRNKPFNFEIGNFVYGTTFVGVFGTILFVTSLHGFSCDAVVFAPMEFANSFDEFDEDDWDYFTEEAAKHFEEWYHWHEPINN